MARSGVLTVKITGDASPLQKSLKGVGGKIGGFAANLVKVGAAAGIGLGVTAVKAFGDFDSAMQQSIAIMGDVSDAMRGKMSDAARKVAKTTKFSAKEAAESYFFLASAGMDAEQSMAALPQVAAFAQAGMFDMATATDLATDAQSALGLAVDNPAKNLKNLTRVTDVFVKANTLANTSVEQISEAMTNKAGAAMRSVGIEIEEGSAVLAAFADQGVKGAEAGTQFAIVLRDLQTKALSNKDAFKKAGVSVFDAKGEMRNMSDIVGDLEGHLDGMSDAQKKAALATLGFSDKSMGSLQTLMGTSDAIREYEKELKKAGGTTADVAAKQMQTFNAKVGLLKDRLMDFAIEIGSRIVPVLLKFGDWVGKVVPKVAEAFKVLSGDDGVSGFGEIMDSVFGNTGKHVGTFKKIGEVILKTAKGFKKAGKTIIKGLDEVFDLVRKNKLILIGMSAAIAGALVAAFTAWAISAGAAAVATIAAIAPVLAIGAALGVLVAGIVWAYKNVDIFRDAVDAVGRFLKNDLMPILKTVASVLSGAFSGAVSAVQSLWDRFGDRIMERIRIAFDFIKKTIGNALKIVQGVIQTVVGIISGDWDKAWKGVKKIVGGIWDQIKNVIKTAIDLVKNSIGLAMDAIRALWGIAWDKIKELGGKAWDRIKTMVSNAFDRVKTTVKSALDAVVDYLRNLPSRFVRGLGNLLGLLKEQGKDLIRGLKNGIVDIWNGLSGWISRLPGKIIGAIGNLGSILIEAGKAAMQGLKDGFVEGFKDAAGYLTSLPGKIIDLKGPPAYDATILIGNGKLIMKGLAEGMRRGFPEVESFAGSIAGRLSGAVTPGLGSVRGGSSSGMSAHSTAQPSRAATTMMQGGPTTEVIQIVLDGKVVAEAIRKHERGLR